VVVAEDTLALTAPKNTMLLAGTVLKLLPVIVTTVPTGPKAGAKELMMGFCAKRADAENKIARKKKHFFDIRMTVLAFHVWNGFKSFLKAKYKLNLKIVQ